MTEQIDDTNHYYEALKQLDCPSTLEGKTTLAMHYAQTGEFQPQKAHENAGQQIYRATEANGYAIGVDTRGTLLWDDDTTELFGRPLLMILSEQASQEYLNYLKQKHISYITTGRDGIDLASALETLRTVFGVNRLAVVGGGATASTGARAWLLPSTVERWSGTPSGWPSRAWRSWTESYG